MGTPITVTPAELMFLRGVFGVGSASDPSQDSAILSTGNVGAGNVPSDPGFYVDLAKYCAELGIDPRDLLAVIASESNFKTGEIGPAFVPTSGPYAGHDVTPRGLIGFTVANIPSVMGWAEWDALPKLSQREQLAYVARVLKLNQQRIGRPYTNAFETYVSVAAPAHLSRAGGYSADDTLYSGDDWITNPGIDSWPNNFQRQAMLRSEVPEMNAGLVDYLHKLAGLGLIHGRVTFGDLSNYLDRMRGTDPNGAGWAGNPARWALAWNLAFRRFLETAQTHVEKSVPYTQPSYPRYQPVVETASAPGSAYSFDSSIPQGPSSGPGGGPRRVAKTSSTPFLGSSLFTELLIGVGVIVGGVVVYQHLKK